MDQKILLAEDQPFMRRTIKTICSSAGFNDITEVDNCKDLMEKLRTHSYTHILLDLILTDGNVLLYLEKIKIEYPELNILVITGESAQQYQQILWKKYDINYFVAKGAPEEKSVRQLFSFLKNEAPENDRIYRKRDALLVELTMREKEILHYLIKGKGPNEIGDILNIAPSSVSVHKKNILERTSTKNVIELKEWASLHGLH